MSVLKEKVSCIRCEKNVHSNRFQSEYFYDFCRRCYRSFCKKVQSHASRARRLKTFGTIEPSEVITLMRETGFACFHCCNPGSLMGDCWDDSHLTIDHDYPLSLGGLHHISNITILCRCCHSLKDNSAFMQTSPWFLESAAANLIERKKRSRIDKKIWREFFKLGGFIDDEFKLGAIVLWCEKTAIGNKITFGDMMRQKAADFVRENRIESTQLGAIFDFAAWAETNKIERFAESKILLSEKDIC